MRNIIVIIDDDEIFATSLRDSLQKRLGVKYEFFVVPSYQQSIAFFSSLSKDDFVFAIVDNHLEEENAGLSIADSLNEKNIQFTFVTADCSIKVLDHLCGLKSCRNIFEKNKLSLMFFQIEKDIINARAAYLQIRKIQNSEDVNVAKGILMSRYSINKITASKKLQRLGSSKEKSIKTLAQSLIFEQEFFAT